MRGPEKASRSARVLHIAQTTAGGIASYFEEIAAYQAARFGRDNVRFLVPDGDAHRPKIHPALIRTYGPASRRPAALLRFARAARREIDAFKPDIVHLHSSFAGAIVRAMLALRRDRPKIVYCPHGWAFSMEIAERKKQVYAAIERRLSAVTDLIHNVSQSEQDLALRFGLPGEKMRVFANGIADTPEPQRGRRSGPLRYLFIGRHDRQKGLDILLEAIPGIPADHAVFDIVGAGILADGAEQAQPSQPNVTFHGWLSRDRTIALLDQADALVMPSRWDAAPIVALEAMRAGVAIIGSDRGALPEMIGDKVGGRIFALNDPSSLATTLRSLDRRTIAAFGRQARQRWSARYRSEQMNAVTCDGYDTLLGAAAMATPESASATASERRMRRLAT